MSSVKAVPVGQWGRTRRLLHLTLRPQRGAKSQAVPARPGEALLKKIKAFHCQMLLLWSSSRGNVVLSADRRAVNHRLGSTRVTLRGRRRSAVARGRRTANRKRIITAQPPGADGQTRPWGLSGWDTTSRTLPGSIGKVRKVVVAVIISKHENSSRHQQTVNTSRPRL